jgi:NADH dehydrogenase/NADH:ubiquinone oxidoreductase subunit G
VSIKIIIDGKEVSAEPDQTILEVARENGIFIPTLCYSPALDAAGMCRLCMVELYEGRRKKYVTACNFPLRREVEIKTNTEELRQGRKILIELLMARCSNSEELKRLAVEYGCDLSRFSSMNEDCLLCGLCARVCEKVGGRALTLSGRGVEIHVNTPFGEVSQACIACGSCVQICPAGAITMEDVDGERILKIHGKEISRIKLYQCGMCNSYYGPVIDLKEVMERVGEGGIPAPHENVCPDCARRKLAKRIADRYYDVI